MKMSCPAATTPKNIIFCCFSIFSTSACKFDIMRAVELSVPQAANNQCNTGLGIMQMRQMPRKLLNEQPQRHINWTGLMSLFARQSVSQRIFEKTSPQPYTNETAYLTYSRWNQNFACSKCLRNRERLPVSDNQTINVVNIQNGPYKSGLSFVSCWKSGLTGLTDATILFITYYCDTSKYCCQKVMWKKRLQLVGSTFYFVSPLSWLIMAFITSSPLSVPGASYYIFIEINQMPNQTDILVDGLFTFVSDLETSCIETLLSRNSVQRRIDQLQSAIMQFKCNSLKLLKQQLPPLMDEASRLNSDLKESIVSDLTSRHQNLEKTRCLHIMRRLLRHKLDQSCHVLNESFQTLSHEAVQKEQEKLQKLATSIRLMQKDLGIEQEQNMTSWRQYASRYDDSIQKHDQSYGQLILRKSFMTSSYKSISVYEDRHEDKNWKQEATQLVENVQNVFRRQMKLGMAQLKNVRNKRISKDVKPPITRSTSRIEKKKETSVEKKVENASAKKIQLKIQKKVQFTIEKKSDQRSDNKSTRATIQSIQSTMSTNSIKPPKAEPEKSRRVIPIKENTSIFQNILKESYETFVKQPK